MVSPCTITIFGGNSINSLSKKSIIDDVKYPRVLTFFITPKSLSKEISKNFKTSLTKSLCCPVEITLVLNFLFSLNRYINGASLIASGLVPKIKVINGNELFLIISSW